MQICLPACTKSLQVLPMHCKISQDWHHAAGNSNGDCMAGIDLPSSSSDYDHDSDASEQKHLTTCERPEDGLASDTAASTGNFDSGDMLQDDAADAWQQRPAAQVPASPISSSDA